jgi:acyl carrier protein
MAAAVIERSPSMSNEELVIKSLARVLKIDPSGISRESDFVNDLGVQKSVVYVQLIVLLEEALDREIDFMKIRGAGTVGAVIDYLDT